MEELRNWIFDEFPNLSSRGIDLVWEYVNLTYGDKWKEHKKEIKDFLKI